MQSLLCNLISNPVVLALVASKAPEGWLLGLPGATWGYQGYQAATRNPGMQGYWQLLGLPEATGATWGYRGYQAATRNPGGQI